MDGLTRADFEYLEQVRQRALEKGEKPVSFQRYDGSWKTELPSVRINRQALELASILRAEKPP